MGGHLSLGIKKKLVSHVGVPGFDPQLQLSAMQALESSSGDSSNSIPT